MTAPNVVPFLPRDALRAGVHIEWCSWSEAWRVALPDADGGLEPATLCEDAQDVALHVQHQLQIRIIEQVLRAHRIAPTKPTRHRVTIPDRLASLGYAVWYNDPAGEFIAAHLDPDCPEHGYTVGAYETAHEAREALWRAARIDYGIARPSQHPTPRGPQGAA